MMKLAILGFGGIYKRCTSIIVPKYHCVKASLFKCSNACLSVDKALLGYYAIKL